MSENVAPDFTTNRLTTIQSAAILDMVHYRHTSNMHSKNALCSDFDFSRAFDEVNSKQPDKMK